MQFAEKDINRNKLVSNHATSAQIYLLVAKSHRIWVMLDLVQVLELLSCLGKFSHLGSLKCPRDCTNSPLCLLSSIIAQSLIQYWVRSAIQSSWQSGKPTATPSFKVQSGKAYLHKRASAADRQGSFRFLTNSSQRFWVICSLSHPPELSWDMLNQTRPRPCKYLRQTWPL